MKTSGRAARSCAAAVLTSLLTLSIPLVQGSATAHPTTRDGTLGPRATVMRAIAARADRLGPGARHLRVEVVRRSPIGIHLRGRQFRAGVPIDGTWLLAHVRHGRIRKLAASGTGLPGAPSRTPISRGRAVADALSALPNEGLLLEPTAERLLVARGGRLVDVWRIGLLTSGGAAVEIDVSAVDGSLLASRDRRVFADTTATVFDPNPVVVLKDTSLRQPGVEFGGFDTDLDEAKLTSALTRLPIREADSSAFAQGVLQGPYARVQGPAALVAGPEGFTFTRSDPRFETTMAYAHIDRLQRYLHSLGLHEVNSEPQDVYAVPVPGFDNSFYVGGFDMIVLGSGGVDDGEDAEVILHEYGHAIHDDQVPGWRGSGETGAMGEGWGDFLAAAYLAPVSSGGFGDLCVAEWDATSYSNDDPPCLRRLDSTKRYPKDMEGEVHADGAMWSAFLWKLRAQLGGTEASRTDNALKLVLTSHELLAPDAGFLDGVEALRDAARGLGRPEWVKAIDKAGSSHGFGRN